VIHETAVAVNHGVENSFSYTCLRIRKGNPDMEAGEYIPVVNNGTCLHYPKKYLSLLPIAFINRYNGRS
jgi:hypothetical protein